jgi:hypothetical protein
MKKFTLTILLTIFSIVIYAQAPKGASKIIVNNSKSAADNFLLVKQQLAENSIGIAQQDKDVFQIITSTINGKYVYVIFCKNNAIHITGTYTTGYDVHLGFGIIDKDEASKITNRGMSGSIIKKSFQSMESFAKELGTNITYGDVPPKKKPQNDDAY